MADSYEIIDVSRKIKFGQGPAGEGVYKLEVEIPLELSQLGKWTAEWSYEFKKAKGEIHLTPPDTPEAAAATKGTRDSPNTWALLANGQQLNTVFFIPDHQDPAPRVECALTLDSNEVCDINQAKESNKLLVKFELASTDIPDELQSFFGWTEQFANDFVNGNSSVLKAGTVLYLPPIGAGKPPTSVRMTRATAKPTDDIGLWMMIKASSEKLSWKSYSDAMDMVLTCGKSRGKYDEKVTYLDSRRSLPFTDTDSYRALKVATEAFLLVNTPTVSDAQNFLNDAGFLERRDYNVLEVKQSLASYNEDWVIPYLQKVADNLKGTSAGAEAEAKLVQEWGACADDRDGWQDKQIEKLGQPLLIELIWSYWMEEMQLVQSMHAVSRRFQNVHAQGARDPLAQLEADSLRPLGNLLWGYVQDEQHRLTLTRRAYEYSHHYGISLIGKAVPQLRPADNRSKFIEAFHNLMSLCAQFFRQADDTTVVADGFPVLNALREVHLLLSEGAGNQFRDLPATARVEMLMEQWILARPEFREFLPRRVAIAYPEDWMHSVDSMRRLQGWGDTNVLHFWHLATCGERIVSSIRWGNWNEVLEPENASNWANFFRPDIQSYIHAYRAVTGVDITLEPVDSTMPSVHLFRRQAATALGRA